MRIRMWMLGIVLIVVQQVICKKGASPKKEGRMAKIKTRVKAVGPAVKSRWQAARERLSQWRTDRGIKKGYESQLKVGEKIRKLEQEGGWQQEQIAKLEKQKEQLGQKQLKKLEPQERQLRKQAAQLKQSDPEKLKVLERLLKIQEQKTRAVEEPGQWMKELRKRGQLEEEVRHLREQFKQ